MFGIGLFELLLLAAVALVILGPEKLPLAARTAGLWYGKLRRTLNNMQSEIEAELNLAEAKRQMQEELAKIKAAELSMQENMQRMEKDIQAMQAQTEQQIKAADTHENSSTDDAEQVNEGDTNAGTANTTASSTEHNQTEHSVKS